MDQKIYLSDHKEKFESFINDDNNNKNDIIVAQQKLAQINEH
jgi:hypothetical protein